MEWRIICVIICCVAGAALLQNFSKRNEQFEYNRFWISKTHRKTKYDVLVCGDSRVYRGVSAKEISSQLDGLTVFNFGYSSGSFSSFMLDQMDDRIDMAGEKVIILGITPYSLTPKSSNDEHIRQELARKKEEVLQYTSTILSALYLFDPIEVTPHFFEKENPNESKYYQRFMFREGWVASMKTPSNPLSALESYKSSFTDNKISDHVVNELIAKIRQWHKEGIKVFAFRPPSTTKMEVLENQLSGFNEEALKQRIQAAGGIWFDFDSSDFSSYDGSHLTEESAIQLSIELGKLIDANIDVHYND